MAKQVSISTCSSLCHIAIKHVIFILQFKLGLREAETWSKLGYTKSNTFSINFFYSKNHILRIVYVMIFLRSLTFTFINNADLIEMFIVSLD
nr:hypothetical protein Itr_chr06CG05080 [Ipomoea trifida]